MNLLLGLPSVQELNAKIVPTYKGEPRPPAEFEKVAVSLCIKVGDSILVGKDPKNGCYVLPGGKVEAGETLVEGMVREVVEELGVKYIEAGWTLEQLEKAFAKCTVEVGNGAKFGARPIEKTYYVATFFINLPLWGREGEGKADCDADCDAGKVNPLKDLGFLGVECFFRGVLGDNIQERTDALLKFVAQDRAVQDETAEEDCPRGYVQLYKKDADVDVTVVDSAGVKEGKMKAFVARTLVGSCAWLLAN